MGKEKSKCFLSNNAKIILGIHSIKITDELEEERKNQFPEISF
jgi:hypothetical protein